MTLDADFHAILARRRARGPSVIRIRFEALRAEALANVLVRGISSVERDLDLGASRNGRTRRRHQSAVVVARRKTARDTPDRHYAAIRDRFHAEALQRLLLAVSGRVAATRTERQLP